MLNILIFGPPGCGKGTQSQLMVDEYHLVHLSTGDIFRQNIGKKTDLGKKAKEYMDNGKLVPDFITIDMLRKEIKNHSATHGFLFDGFPRTIKQAESLDKLLLNLNQKISMMISIEVSEAELVKRLLKRGEESDRADDQDENIIFNRIAIYKKETEILKSYYENQNKLFSVNGEQSIGNVKEQIFTLINLYKVESKIK